MMEDNRNPSYSGSRGRKTGSLRPAQAKLERPCLKNKIQMKELAARFK
jgi:hypothetical protein